MWAGSISAPEALDGVSLKHEESGWECHSQEYSGGGHSTNSRRAILIVDFFL